MNIRIYCYTYATCRNSYVMEIEYNDGKDYKDIKITRKQFDQLKSIGVYHSEIKKS